MQTIRIIAPRIAHPLMCSAIGSVIGNRIIKTKSQSTAIDAFAISASAIIPFALRFTGLPAAGLGCVLSAVISGLLSDDTPLKKIKKPVQQSQSKAEIPSQDTPVIQSFDALFNRTHTDKITETQRQTTALNNLSTYMNDTQISAANKVKTIETIFKNFKDKNDKNFNSSEIWTGLLKNLSEQTDIPDTTKISLAVADSEKDKDTKLEFTFGQLKDFINSFKSNVNLGNIDDDLKQAWHDWRLGQISKLPNRSNITEKQVEEIFNTRDEELNEDDKRLKDTYGYEKYEKTNDYKKKRKDIDKQIKEKIDTEINKFLDKLEINKPYLKVLHHSNHYTSFIINRTSQDNFQIIHIDSLADEKYKTANFNNQAIKDYLKNFIENGTGEKVSQETKYQTFFSDDRSFEIPLDKVIRSNVSKDNNNVPPYTQAANACHHISVMNLLKFFIEKYPNS